MALTKNISVTSEEKLQKDFFGKFNSANSILGAAVGYIADPTVDDSFLDLKSKTFFQDVYKRTKSHTLKYKIFRLNKTTCCIVLPKFIANKIKLEIVTKPILSDTIAPYCAPIPFSNTFENTSNSFVCNGNQVYPELSDNLFKIFGKVYQNNTRLFPGSSVISKNLPAFSLFIDNLGNTSWTFWTPNPTEDGPFSGNGFGGLTPVLFKPLATVYKYGGLDDSDPTVIKSESYNKLLKYDLAHNNVSRQGAGKHILAYKGVGATPGTLENDMCLVIMNEDGVLPGFAIDDVRDDLFNLGFEFALGLDGSDSVFLFERKNKPSYHIGEKIKNYIEPSMLQPLYIPKDHASSKNIGNILRTAYAIK
jgi:hypothetical protein